MARELYEKQTWENLPSETTPLSAERLTHIEDGIKSAHDNRALKEIYNDDSINLGRKAGTEIGTNSTAEGINTSATEYASHAEGVGGEAKGSVSHAEGYGTVSCGSYSHSEGYNTTAGYSASTNSSQAPHAEGSNTIAAGNYAHAEGYGTKAGENPGATAAHAEGYETQAISPMSHAEGYQATAKANFSHSEGFGTIASDTAQHAGGKYNVETTGAVVIGGGTSDEDRKNIHTLDWEGNAKFAGTVTDGNGNSIQPEENIDIDFSTYFS